MSSKPSRTDTPLIIDLLDSLRRRSKALKHKNASPAIERFVDARDGLTEERVELRFTSRKRQQLTLTLWEDRTVRVIASESVPQAGWKFTYTSEGRLVGSEGGRSIVSALEASLSAMFEMTGEDVARLETIWGPLLAKGPQSA
jgi:hypothetical protein